MVVATSSSKSIHCYENEEVEVEVDNDDAEENT
jgi:hypothetical protein